MHASWRLLEFRKHGLNGSRAVLLNLAGLVRECRRGRHSPSSLTVGGDQIVCPRPNFGESREVLFDKRYRCRRVLRKIPRWEVRVRFCDSDLAANSSLICAEACHFTPYCIRRRLPLLFFRDRSHPCRRVGDLWSIGSSAPDAHYRASFLRQSWTDNIGPDQRRKITSIRTMRSYPRVPWWR